MARAIAGHDDITDGAMTGIYDVCMSLAIDRRRAAYEFLPQLLGALPPAVPSLLVIKVVHEMPNTAAGILPSPLIDLGTNTNGVAIDCNYLFAAARLEAFYASSSSSGGPSSTSEYNVTIPHLMTRPDGYLSLIACLYRRVPGTNITAIETLKKLAVDCLTTLVATTDHHRMSAATAIEAVVHYLLREQSNGPMAATTMTTTTTTAMMTTSTAMNDQGEMISNIMKSIQEDVALLRRISRIPDSSGINGKALLRSGTSSSKATLTTPYTLSYHTPHPFTPHYTLSHAISPTLSRHITYPLTPYLSHR